MLSVICFSKDRPLQLQAYLESLFYYGGLKESSVHILYTQTGSISYNRLIETYPLVHWHAEVNFEQDLRRVVDGAENYVLWGCDDVVFKDHFNINSTIKALESNPQLVGFSLRLGTNTDYPPALQANGYYLCWNWAKTTHTHWNYPWEVSGSVYRKADILAYVQLVRFKNPNYFEDLFYRESCENLRLQWSQNRPLLGCFHSSKCLTITINRVQEDFLNDFDDLKTTDVATLYNWFETRKRMDWERLFQTQNGGVHVGSDYFLLTEQPTPLPAYILGITQSDQEPTIKISNKLRLKIVMYRFFIPLKEWIRARISRKMLVQLKKALS